MALGIPNLVDAAFAPQAELDSNDVDAIVAGFGGICVVSGCAVTAQVSPNMTVAVAVGIISSSGTVQNVIAGNATIGAADLTNPRFDTVVATSGGAIATRAGTPAAGPVFPNLTAGDVTLAAVYVPANATVINTNQIIDKRVVRGQGRLWVSDYGPTNIGQAAALHIGAGSTTPNAASLAWGDGSGWKLNLGPVVASVFTSRFSFLDTGELDIVTGSPTQGLQITNATSGPWHITLVANTYATATYHQWIDSSARFTLYSGSTAIHYWDTTGRQGWLTAPSTDRLVAASPTMPNAATTMYGIVMTPTFAVGATVAANDYYGAIAIAASTPLAAGYVFHAAAPTLGGSATITNLAGYLAENQGKAGVTNAYGFWAAAQSGATLNVAARLDGGTQANLWLNSDTASVAGGIAYGTAKDVVTYRGSAGLSVDDGGSGVGGQITLERGTSTQLYIGDRSSLFDWVLYVSNGQFALYDGANQFVMAGNQLQVPDAGGSIAIGTHPASAGAICLPTNRDIQSRNQANSGNISLIFADVNDFVNIGYPSSPVVMEASLSVGGFVASKNLGQMQMGANFVGGVPQLYGGFPTVTTNGTASNPGYSDMVSTLYTGAGTLGFQAGVTGTGLMTTAGAHPEFTAIFKTDASSITSCRYWIALASVSLAGLAVAPTTQHIAGFRYDTGLDTANTNWRAVTCNGTSATVVDTGLAVTANTRYEMRVVFDVQRNAFCFYINGTFYTAIATTQPTAAQGMEVSNTAITAVVRNIAVSHMTLRQN